MWRSFNISIRFAIYCVRLVVLTSSLIDYSISGLPCFSSGSKASFINHSERKKIVKIMWCCVVAKLLSNWVGTRRFIVYFVKILVLCSFGVLFATSYFIDIILSCIIEIGPFEFLQIWKRLLTYFSSASCGKVTAPLTLSMSIDGIRRF